MIQGLPYTINFTDESVAGKTPFVIQPNTTDGPIRPNVDSPDSSATAYHTSIVLPGMGLVQYGERLLETIVHMMEHFASATAPVAPTIGQLWYDTGNLSMKYYNGTTWIPVGGDTIVGSQYEYNALVAVINPVIGAPSGNTATTAIGYNQNLLPVLTGTTKPTVAQWQALWTTIRNVAFHQGRDGNAVTTPPNFGFVVPAIGATYGTYALSKVLGQMETSAAASADSTNRLVMGNLDPETTTLGTGVRTTAWGGEINYGGNVQFQSAAHMRAFFNAGGTINLTIANSDTSTATNLRWYNFLNSVGTIKIGAFKTINSSADAASVGYGLYNIPATMTEIVSIYRNSDHIGVYALVNWSTFTIQVQIQLFDRQTGTAPGGGGANGLYGSLYRSDGRGGYYNDTQTGTWTGTISTTKASSLYLNNPTIPTPTWTQTVAITA